MSKQNEPSFGLTAPALTTPSRGFRALAISLCCSLFFFVSLGVKSFLSKPVGNGNYKSGTFDFNMLRSPKVPWSGPRPGVKIDLAGFVNSDHQRLANVVGMKQPFMLVLVDPKCGLCKESVDSIKRISAALRDMDCNYFAVSFNPNVSPSNLDAYMDLLGVHSKAFTWSPQSAPLDSFAQMVTPSHLLISANGAILETWPGSSWSRQLRQEMAEQIIAGSQKFLRGTSSKRDSDGPFTAIAIR
jgi:hypothetical protein